jgi:hypothetical protein
MDDKNIKEFYKNLGSIWCPTLNDHIAFTNDGLRHLIRKSGIRRTKREQARRFSLLPYAKEIIQDDEVEIIHKENMTTHLVKRHGTTILTQSRASFWTLRKNYENTIVTVIIRQIENKEKHFFSIYDSKSKNRTMAVD